MTHSNRCRPNPCGTLNQTAPRPQHEQLDVSRQRRQSCHLEHGAASHDCVSRRSLSATAVALLLGVDREELSTILDWKTGWRALGLVAFAGGIASPVDSANTKED